MSALSDQIIQSIAILKAHAKDGQVHRTLHELELVHLAAEGAARELRALRREKLEARPAYPDNKNT